MHDRALKLSCNPEIDLALIHWPVPHFPGYYDSARHRFTESPSSDYVDNLVLADDTLGEVRRVLERAGLWDRTTVMITADHNFRVEFWRKFRGLTQREMTVTHGKSEPVVPFLVKLPGQNPGLTYAQPFHAIFAARPGSGGLGGQDFRPARRGWLVGCEPAEDSFELSGR